MGSQEAGHEGSLARTDKDIQVSYPEQHDLSPSPSLQARVGRRAKRTLATFSLEGRVGVVTGGARGLGLVMAQGLVLSGADVAIVDLIGQSLPVCGSDAGSDLVGRRRRGEAGPTAGPTLCE